MTGTPFAMRLSQAQASSTALRAELASWCARAQKDELWHRYRSQLVRMDRTIASLLGQADDNARVIGEDAAGWRMLENFERALLAANGIWSYFRGKYLFRDHPSLGQALRLADDFVWDCYRPVQLACAPQVPREPPLVYFSEMWSPFALARDRSFANELHFADSKTARILEDVAFEQVLARLPLPLVSVPWLYASSPPGLLIIAHEVGHIVAADFALDAALEADITAAPWDNGTALWQGWREESFADLFGVIAAGDGFVGALAGLLAVAPARLAAETPAGGRYPPRALRMEIALQALAQRNNPQTDVLRQQWAHAYPALPDLTGFAADIAQMIDLACNLRCGGTTLSELFTLKEGNVTALLARAANGQGLVTANFDAIAALVLAQRIGDGRIEGVAVEEAMRAIGRFVDTRPTGFRGSKPAEQATQQSDADLGIALWQELAGTQD
jgi:hypothetical protein